MAVTRDTLRQLRALRTQVGVEVDATVRTLQKTWVAERRSLDKQWAVASAAVVALAVELGRWPRPWELARIPDLRSALDGTDVALEDLGRRTDKTVTETSGTVIVAVLAAEALILASQYPAAQRALAAAQFAAAVPAWSAATGVAFTAAQVRAAVQPLAGETFANVQRLIVRGVPQGDPRTMTRQVAGLARASFEGGAARAATIARTEVLDAHRQASHAFRVANLQAATGWVWVSTLSRTSCSACWAMHGTVYPGAAEVGPLGHASCRCVALTLRFGDDIGALPDARARFDALPEADQVAILGPGRHALLRVGAIEWGELATRRDGRGWRPSYGPRPLSDLQRLAATRRTI